MCATNARSEIEKYAENFASELLMPTAELKKQAQKYAKDGYVDLDGVLLIADYFGASFLSCLYKIAYRLHMIQGDTDAETLQKLARKYKPAVKRKEQGKYDTVLYEQLFDAIGDNFKLKPTEYACQKFKTEYVFHDSRLEGIDIDMEMAAAIVMDLRFHKQDSPYCREENQNIVEVAGLTFAYDYAFREAESEISIYDAKHLNEQLFSTAPCSEYGGRYRESNTLVLGAKFETIDYRKDVDGFHPINVGRMSIGLPCYVSATPNGILELLKRYNIETSGKKCVVLGRSNIVGKPMAALMMQKAYPGDATVTVCHSRSRDLVKECQEADIIIAALGQPNFVKAEMVKEGAVVIDVGTTRVPDATKKSGFKLTGDVKFDEVAPKCSFITPVPGGVGPMTIVSLMKNTLLAGKKAIYQ